MTESVAQAERQRHEVARTGNSLDLWFGMVGGPMSGMLMVWVNYPLDDRAWPWPVREPLVRPPSVPT